MRVLECLSSLPEKFTGWPDRAVPVEQWAAPIISDVTGFTSPTVATLLNHACRHLLPGEYYVEIGSLHGASLICALHANDVHAIAVDNFSQFGATSSRLLDNLRKYGLIDLKPYGLIDRVGVVKTHSADFWHCANDHLRSRKIGLLFYDGDHSTAETLSSLEAAIPYLSDEALIVVDDLNWEVVERAVNLFVDQHAKQAKAKFRFYTPDRVNQYPIWWNGLAIIVWRR